MRILISACLLGASCRYDGRSKPHSAAMELAKRYGVEMPIVAAVDAVVKGEMSAEESVERLMRREQKPEKPEQK